VKEREKERNKERISSRAATNHLKHDFGNFNYYFIIAFEDVIA